MKRVTSLALILALLFCSACGIRKQPLQKPVNFYYCTAEVAYDGLTGIMATEQRESVHFENDMTALLNAYLQGPTEEELVSPFPSDVTVVNCYTSGSTVLVVLSSEFAQLTGIDLTVACACLSSTVFELIEQDRIQISAFESQLVGQTVLTVDRNTMFMVDIPTDATQAP